MSYLRNGNRVFTAKDRAIQAERRALNIRYSPDDIYRKAEREFALTRRNLDNTAVYVLRWQDQNRVLDAIREAQQNIIQRRFEMFATMLFLQTHIWTDGVSASGDPKDRRAWLYYHQQQLKFWRAIAERLHIAA